MIKSEILVPLLNANEPEARLVGIHVEDGQTVEKGSALFTLETTKAAAEVEAPESGFIRVLAKEGDILAVGDRLAYITEIIDPKVIMPAVAQGAIAIEIRENDQEVMNILQKINHLPTWTSILAERAFLRTLEGGCQVPLGCYSQIKGEEITLNGFVASVDGKNYLKETTTGNRNAPEDCGIELANKLLDKGAAKILNQIKKNSEG